MTLIRDIFIIFFQTSEQEQEHFEEYVSKFGEARFSDLANPKLQAQDYTVSSNKEEWKYVQRLLPFTLKPVVPKKDYYPSGRVGGRMSC